MARKYVVLLCAVNFTQDRADVDDQARALTTHAGEHGLNHAQDADDVGVAC